MMDSDIPETNTVGHFSARLGRRKLTNKLVTAQVQKNPLKRPTKPPRTPFTCFNTGSFTINLFKRNRISFIKRDARINVRINAMNEEIMIARDTLDLVTTGKVRDN